MAISINQFKNGLTVSVDEQVYVVVEFQHVKPGKGAAFVRVKLKNLRNGAIQDMTFRGEEKIEEAYIEERKLQYQYRAGDMFHFMDQDNYEEVSVPVEIMRDQEKFLKDNLEVVAFTFKDEILSVSLPNFIQFEIKHTEPGMKGDTAKSGTKPATIETGAIIQVPLFINQGDKIKVDTRSGQYIERAY